MDPFRTSEIVLFLIQRFWLNLDLVPRFKISVSIVVSVNGLCYKRMKILDISCLQYQKYREIIGNINNIGVWSPYHIIYPKMI